MKKVFLAAGIVTLTLLTYFQFPGHTWLQQDTQIYAPMLEHLWDPTVLRQDILVQRPHLSFTLYDEIAIGLRKVTGAGFREVLTGEQLVTRSLGIWGIYLMATAAGLSAGPALLVAAMLSLGTMIAGPSVLTFEYEPDPRGFAVPLLFLGTGLVAHARYFAAGAAGAAAFLLHPPAVYPFWGVYFCLALWPTKPEVMRRRLYEFVPLFCAAILLLAASRHQAGAGEMQVFFSRLTPLQEQLQRMRASYAWISVWWRNWLAQYLFLYAVTIAGYLRLREKAPFDLRFFLIGLPLVGMLSMPLSALLLEEMKWALIPQFQPMRALLLVTVIALFVAAVAGFRAVEQRRYPEGFLWFALVYLAPTNIRVLAIPSANRVIVVGLLALSACLAAWAESKRRRWAALALASAALAPFFLIPGLGRVRNYPRLHNPELAQLSAWARTSTPKDAVFLFPDADKELYPGIFRADALRAVYVDWKGGGQVNYLKELGEQWWSRWEKAMTAPLTLQEYRKLGVDYLVYRTKDLLPGAAPVFQNVRFIVYRISGPV